MDEVWSIEQATVDGRTRLTVTGELDAHTATDLRQHLDCGEGDLELDLSGVAFIDSSGLAALIDGHRRFDARGRRLVIVERSDAVQRVLELSGVAGRLDLEPR